MENLFMGICESKRDIASYDDAGNKVLNVIVSNAKKLVGDIVVLAKQTVVLYRQEAIKGDREIKEGDCLVFTEAERRARSYVDKGGVVREVVDITAMGYTVVKKKAFTESYDELVKMSIPADQLVYTDADRDKAHEDSAQADSDQKDDDLPFG